MFLFLVVQVCTMYSMTLLPVDTRRRFSKMFFERKELSMSFSCLMHSVHHTVPNNSGLLEI